MIRLSVVDLDDPTLAVDRLAPASGVSFEPVSETRHESWAPASVLCFGSSVSLKQRQIRSMQSAPLHEIGVFRVTEGMVVGRGRIANQDGALLAGRAITGPADELLDQRWGTPLAGRSDGTFESREPAPSIRDIRGPAILGIFPGYRIYGHLLVDWIPRVMTAVDHAPRDVPILVARDFPVYGLEMAELLGISQERLVRVDHEHEIIRASELIVPTQVRRASLWWPGAASHLRRFSERVAPSSSSPARIYVDRASVPSQRRRMLERQRVKALLQSRGFTPVSPERLPLPEQIGMFAKAEAVVGEAGSGLHGSLFASEDAAVGVFQSESLGSFLQASLCHALGQRVAMAFGETVSLSSAADFGDFIIDDASVHTMIDYIEGTS